MKKIKGLAIVALVSVFGSSLNADFLGSENVARNLANQNFDVAQYNGKRYCDFMDSSFTPSSQSNQSVAEDLAKRYFQENPNWLPYKAYWMDGCINSVSQKRH